MQPETDPDHKTAPTDMFRWAGEVHRTNSTTTNSLKTAMKQKAKRGIYFLFVVGFHFCSQLGNALDNKTGRAA
jgi:hypothetical protein